MTQELKLPELGENIEAGTIMKVLVAPGEAFAVDQALVEVETGKATIEVPAAVSGTVQQVLVAQGDTVKVGQVMLTFVPAGEVAKPVAAPAAAAVAAASEPATTVPAAAAPIAQVASASGLAAAAPHVRQFAREIGVDLQQVAGSGPGGRVSVEDVKRHAREAPPARPALAGPGVAVEAPLPDFGKFGPVERVPMSSVRQVTAQQMARAWSAIPHVMLEARADVTELEAFRQRYKARVEAAGGKLTLTSILVKVVAAALHEFPNFNASVDVAARELVLKKYVHVGVATDTPRGLLVPVVRDADRKTLVQLGVEVHQLAEKARLGKLAPVELQGGSMSVTNLGGFGVGHFTAVINHPEVAILAVGRAEVQPVHDGKEFHPRRMLPLSLSLDHRVLDGADGARFLRFVVDAIEQPLLLAL